MERTLLSLKEIAALLNISPATINYYTNIGLFQVGDRKGNRRLYNKQRILERFEEIKELRKAGYSLGLIRQKFSNNEL